MIFLQEELSGAEGAEERFSNHYCPAINTYGKGLEDVFKIVLLLTSSSLIHLIAST